MNRPSTSVWSIINNHINGTLQTLGKIKWPAMLHCMISINFSDIVETERIFRAHAIYLLNYQEGDTDIRQVRFQRQATFFSDFPHNFFLCFSSNRRKGNYIAKE